jgi:hypothetical protein
MRQLAAVLIAVVAAFALAVGNSTAATSQPYVVVDIVGFIGPDCSAAVIEISNQGDAEQAFGWTLTLKVPKLGISETFSGQQPLAAGSSFESIIGTGITEPGTYLIEIAPGDTSGKTKPGRAVLRLPATC